MTMSPSGARIRAHGAREEVFSREEGEREGGARARPQRAQKSASVNVATSCRLNGGAANTKRETFTESW